MESDGSVKVTKEIYTVECPKHIRFGDPMYFEEFKGKQLDRLVVDYKVPKQFAARVVLTEQPIEDMPGVMVDTITLYLAPEQTIGTYMDGYYYDSQDVNQKEIGVDTAVYLYEIDGRYEEFHTGSDGYWGECHEFSRKRNGLNMVDAAVITACMPESEGFEDMRRLVHYFFRDVQLQESGPDHSLQNQGPVQ